MPVVQPASAREEVVLLIELTLVVVPLLVNEPPLVRLNRRVLADARSVEGLTRCRTFLSFLSLSFSFTFRAWITDPALAELAFTFALAFLTFSEAALETFLAL